MLAIQDAALQLFSISGYSTVSVEDVAASAEVSPRTVYRYFGSKEQLVVWDPMDGRLVNYLRTVVAQTPSLVESLLSGYVELIRYAMSPEDEERLKTRMLLISTEPALRAGEHKQMEALARAVYHLMIESTLAEFTSMRLRIASYHLAWGLLAIADEWVADNCSESFHSVLERTIPILIKTVESTLHARSDS